MSAAAAPTIHRPTGAARPPHLWSRHGVIWGVVLLAFGFVLGLTVTTLGAASTLAVVCVALWAFSRCAPRSCSAH